DVLRFAQHTPQFLALNETGQVPVLVSDGLAYTEASAICEYLEEAFPARPLMPSDPLGRWRVRVWQRYVDDGLAASVCELAWERYGRAALGALEIDSTALQAAIERIPAQDRRAAWKAAVAGLEAEQLARDRSRIEAAVARLETDLADSSWLAGPGYSLADVAAFSYLRYVPTLCPEVLSEQSAPRVTAWMQRVEARPAVRASLARARSADPFGIAAPGPEQVRWG
ncbi:MAG TPA: glutathione S-transferase family protein, partial [Steroidobacteraceae bacterium]|nr:glutathione S-transferase family protein [Steroidobacteraceae bacterium]